MRDPNAGGGGQDTLTLPAQYGRDHHAKEGPNDRDLRRRPGHGRHVIFPCSQSQKRFWFESQLHPDNSALNVAVRWRLDGDVVHAHLEQAWNLIIERHQPLRSHFTTIDGEPYQIVEPSVAFHIPVIDVTTLAEWIDAYFVTVLACEARDCHLDLTYETL